MTRQSLAALVAALAVVLPLAAVAQHAGEGNNVLACEGAFAKDSNHAKLVAAFGKSSVAILDVETAGGAKAKASVIYPDESRRRVEVLWHDDNTRSRPATITVGFRSHWRAVRGLHIGTELAEVEKINGKPFKLRGFDWEYGGRVSSWEGGALAKLNGGCELRLGFDAWADAPEAERDKVSGNKEFLSTDPNMRASKPTVSEIILSYPQ
jgi:hypothetical protein